MEDLTQKIAVSIPYGTIKSNRRETACMPTTWFQFLMVRLKVLIQLFINSTIAMFQFLMVRLKVSKELLILCPQSRFNSLWYD